MRFTKMQGCGNDYIYVDCLTHPMPHDPAGLSRAISDRHFGVGGDGLILICPSDKADARMRMFNADGSEAEMCGNGLRCVAKYLYDHGLVRKPALTVESANKLLPVELEIAGGLLLMSYATRFTPATLLMIRVEIRPSSSYGRCAQSAVMKSSVCTARSATTFS